MGRERIVPWVNKGCAVFDANRGSRYWLKARYKYRRSAQSTLASAMRTLSVTHTRSFIFRTEPLAPTLPMAIPDDALARSVVPMVPLAPMTGILASEFETNRGRLPLRMFTNSPRDTFRQTSDEGTSLVLMDFPLYQLNPTRAEKQSP